MPYLRRQAGPDVDSGGRILGVKVSLHVGDMPEGHIIKNEEDGAFLLVGGADYAFGPAPGTGLAAGIV